jgi:hypothetical protein
MPEVACEPHASVCVKSASFVTVDTTEPLRPEHIAAPTESCPSQHTHTACRAAEILAHVDQEMVPIKEHGHDVQ